LPQRTGVVDYGSHRFAIQRCRQLARLQSVDELDLVDMAAIQHDLQHRPFHDHVVEVALQQLLHADPRDERRARLLFGSAE
jgi:dGTP triphosphohydrolase